MIKSILGYGITIAMLLIILKWIDYRLFTGFVSLEVYAGIIATIFTVLGVWIGLRLTSPKVVTVERENEFELDAEKLKSHGISNREYDVLGLMAKGCSNQEIADELYISLNTVKTHASSLFSKLDAKRRTQAIQQAKQKGLLP